MTWRKRAHLLSIHPHISVLLTKLNPRRPGIPGIFFLTKQYSQTKSLPYPGVLNKDRLGYGVLVIILGNINPGIWENDGER